MTWTIGIYLFDGAEVLDFAGPFEVFSTAARVHGRQDPPSPPPFVVVTVGHGPGPIVARGGLRVQPAFGMQDHPQLDVLINPGGMIDAELERPEVEAWIRRTAAAAAARRPRRGPAASAGVWGGPPPPPPPPPGGGGGGPGGEGMRRVMSE